MASLSLRSAALAAATLGPAGRAAAEPDRRLSTSVSLGHSIGSGTFITGEETDAELVTGSLGLGPRYKLTDRLTAGASWSLGWEYTPVDSSTGRRYFPSDIGLSLGHSSIYKDGWSGVNVSASLGATLPVSYESRFAHRITTLSLGPSLSRAFLSDRLSLSYTFKFAKTFVTRANPGFTTDDAEGDRPGDAALGDATIRDERAILLSGCRGTEGVCTGGPLNPNFSISNSFGLSYQLTTQLSASASFAIGNAWKLAVEADPDDAVQDTDEPGRSAAMSASLGLSYALSDTFSLGASLSSAPGIDAKEHRLRLPFTDPYAANNSTQLSFDVSAKF